VKQPRTRTAPPPEQAFLETYDPNQFDRPSVTVDVVMLTVKERTLEVLLVQRGEHPFKDTWGLPGGFVQMSESLEDAAARVLRSKTGLEDVFLEQLYTFGNPDRDPRTRVITVSYYALVSAQRLEALKLGKNVKLALVNVPWAGEVGGPVEIELEQETVPLAFDHAQIIGTAVKRLRGKLDYAPVGFQLLPERFTLRALQDVHETIHGHTVNKDSFRRRMQLSGQLEPTGEREEGTDYRPAEFYIFKEASAL
jgi:8-oxo-dGTP diphosphatase